MTTPFAPAPRVLERAASNEYYRRAVETPDYSRAVALRHKSIRARGALPITDWPPLPTDADADIDGWLDGVAAADTLERARAAKVEALNALIADCDRTIQAVATAPDRALQCLGDDLSELMDQVADAVDRLDGARTARDALMKGGAAAAVWRDELPALRDAYDAIRQAQAWIMAGDERWIHSRSKYLDDGFASRLAIRNIDSVFPAWREPAQHVQTINGQEPDPRPWPTDPVEQLVWLVVSDAQPWVPTTRQLDELTAGRRRSTPEVTNKTTDNRDKEDCNA